MAASSGGYGTHSLLNELKKLGLEGLARKAYPPMPTLNVIPEAELRAIQAEIFKPNSVILNVGSGAATGCGQRLWEGQGAESLTLINMDIGPGGGVGLVGDAHTLPLADHSVDAVAMQAVLEHLPNPESAIAEVERVLKPGGVFYVEMPFLQGFHADPHDYQRYTLEGLRQRLAGFDEERSGVSIGPFCTLVWIVRDGLSSCFRNRWLYAGSRFIWGWLLSPLRYLDLLVRNNPAAYRLANEYYFLGRKSGH